ncbi:MAG: regulatory protein RecX [Thermoleophilia bacterium]
MRVGPDPRDPTRVRVELDGGRRLVIDVSLVSELGLSKGVRLGGPALDRLLREGDLGAARARALRYLETRERSRAEVQRRLARYGYEPALIEDVVVWLVHLGYVDDRRFAQWFARARSHGSWGPRRITQDLLQRGVERSLVAEVVGTMRPEGQGATEVVAELAALVQRRFARELVADPAKAERHIASFLERRGHGWDVIRAILRQVGTEAEERDARGPEDAEVS